MWHLGIIDIWYIWWYLVIWHNLATQVLHKHLLTSPWSKALIWSWWKVHETRASFSVNMSMSTFVCILSILCFKFQQCLMMFDDFSSIWTQLHIFFWREFLESTPGGPLACQWHQFAKNAACASAAVKSEQRTSKALNIFKILKIIRGVDHLKILRWNGNTLPYA